MLTSSPTPSNAVDTRVTRANYARGFGQHLPFEPGVVILAAGELSAQDDTRLRDVRERFPNALLVATTERLREPAPSRLLTAGAHEVVKSPTSTQRARFAL
ncbi:MAG: hypothetical protein U5Q44_01460 [Dehalococcoidia bacterium]|nr:hypothetical protein [Dehalococcoidia bacterium]